MPTSATIQFIETDEPIETPVTKFGGEPCWLEAPQWPTSRELLAPMAFIGQVALSDVPSLPQDLRESGKVAYLFMTDEEAVVSTWEPEGGENAVIIQPGGEILLDDVEARAVCPERSYSEGVVRRTLQEEPVFTDQSSGNLGVVGHEVYSLEGDNTLYEMLGVSKLGGVPCFIQRVEYPAGGPWHFVLQLGEYHKLSEESAFNPNFGGGRAHVFVSEDGRRGRILWQC